VGRLAHRALGDGTLLKHSASDTWPYSAACYALLYAGEADGSSAALNRAIELSQQQGSPVAFGHLSRVRGTAHYLRGDLLEAQADLESAIESYSEAYEHGLPWTLAFLVLCLLERGDLAGAGRMLALAGDEERWRAQPSFRAYLYALGRLRAAQGRRRDGFEALLDCGREALRMNFPNPAASPWRSDAALLAAHLGERDRADELVAEDLRLARAFGAPHAVGAALRTTGLIEGGDRGLDQLAASVRVLDGSGFNLELARSLSEQGAALRRRGRRRDALEPLRRGLDLASRCGALVLAKRAREELIACGARPRRERIGGVDALTASELRVARMAAEGMTNREIAQALFVTIRTVTTHLGHVYQKLDVSSREQLPNAIAADPGS
jgi:ATP/maltotriose-dependent transcriptional regulator MalT